MHLVDAVAAISISDAWLWFGLLLRARDMNVWYEQVSMGKGKWIEVLKGQSSSNNTVECRIHASSTTLCTTYALGNAVL